MFLKIRKLFSLTSTCCQMYDKDFGFSIKLLFHRKLHYGTETIDDPMTSFFHIRFKSAHIGSLHSLFLLKGLNLKEYRHKRVDIQ